LYGRFDYTKRQNGGAEAIKTTKPNTTELTIIKYVTLLAPVILCFQKKRRDLHPYHVKIKIQLGELPNFIEDNAQCKLGRIKEKNSVVLIGGLRLEGDLDLAQYVGDDCHGARFRITSKYHKSSDFQDSSANREFLGLTQDWAFRSWGMSGVRFSGHYGIVFGLSCHEAKHKMWMRKRRRHR
jgi:hypothetical protein